MRRSLFVLCVIILLLLCFRERSSTSALTKNTDTWILAQISSAIINKYNAYHHSDVHDKMQPRTMLKKIRTNPSAFWLCYGNGASLSARGKDPSRLEANLPIYHLLCKYFRYLQLNVGVLLPQWAPKCINNYILVVAFHETWVLTSEVASRLICTKKTASIKSDGDRENFMSWYCRKMRHKYRKTSSEWNLSLLMTIL